MTYSYVTRRKREGPVTAAQLERCDPGEPRELATAQTNVRLLRGEIETLAGERPTTPDAPRAVLRQAVLNGPCAARHAGSQAPEAGALVHLDLKREARRATSSATVRWCSGWRQHA